MKVASRFVAQTPEPSRAQQTRFFNSENNELYESLYRNELSSLDDRSRLGESGREVEIDRG